MRSVAGRHPSEYAHCTITWSASFKFSAAVRLCYLGGPTVSSLSTFFTPLTFLASLVAFDLPLSVSTRPLMVTTPSCTATSKARL